MKFIKDFINKQKKLNLLRELKVITYKDEHYIQVGNKKYIDFSSNDYLSLSTHPYLKKRSIEFTEKYGTGGNASRLLSGTFEYHILLEEKIKSLKNKEEGLIFGSGFIANSTIIPSLVKEGDIIFADRLVHASIIDGILISKARFFRYKHNDIEHLEYLLKKERNKYKNSIIITESIFSMDGDKARLKDIVFLKNKYNSFLYVDEAHSTGIFGKNGAGLIEEEKLSNEVEIIMGTFGKALGSYGAYITCNKDIKKFLINKARGFIYSTALPPGVIGASIGGIEMLTKEPFRRKKLLANSKYLRDRLKENGIVVKGDSPIIPIIIGDTEKTITIAKKLRDLSFYILPIRPPTVPQNSSRLRISLNYSHSKDIINNFIEKFLNIYENYKN